MIVLVLSKTINCSLLVKQINFTEMNRYYNNVIARGMNAETLDGRK